MMLMMMVVVLGLGEDGEEGGSLFYFNHEMHILKTSDYGG